MTKVSSVLTRVALVAALTGGAMAASAVPAAADVACNRYGECWHVRDHYTNYPTGLGVLFHDEAWWAGQRHHRNWHWRNDRADDHGYYNHGRWHRF